MEYTAQFTNDCLWRVDGEKRVCTGGHESDGYPCIRYRRLCLALSVFMCLGRERHYYDVLKFRCTGEFPYMSGRNKGRYSM